MSDESPEAENDRDEPAVMAERREKLARLRESGIEPFPHEFDGRVDIASVREAHDGLEDGEETDSSYRVAGRIAARRDMGKTAFLDLVDGSGRIQLQSRADDIGDAHDLLVSLDLGDIVGVDGTAFKTKRGELTLRITGWRLLAKSLRPPPDKFHGLEDVDTRYRHRELDLIANPEVRERFVQRARVVTETRAWLDRHGFVEVETPVLQPLYGGALARPFTTHHNALDRDLYLRIATELYLKRCIVGGIERVYELGKDFRNEGISFKHNPEFTMLEWYEAYADYEDAARASRAAGGPRRRGGPRHHEGRARRHRDRPGAAVAAGDAARRDPGAHRHRRDRASDPRGAGRRDGLRAERRGGLGQARRRPALQGGRAQSDRSPRSSSTTRSRCRRSRSATATDEGLVERWEAYRRRLRDRERVHRAQRPGRAAPPLRAAGARSCGAGTRRRSRWT